jgi:hypothetical protein
MDPDRQPPHVRAWQTVVNEAWPDDPMAFRDHPGILVTVRICGAVTGGMARRYSEAMGRGARLCPGRRPPEVQAVQERRVGAPSRRPATRGGRLAAAAVHDDGCAQAGRGDELLVVRIAG